MIHAKENTFFLVETSENDQYPLMKAFNGNGFTRAYEDSAVYKFDSEDTVKQACAVQNMMNTIFGSKRKVSYVKEDVQRELFNEKGEKEEMMKEGKDTENTQQQTGTTAIP